MNARSWLVRTETEGNDFHVTSCLLFDFLMHTIIPVLFGFPPLFLFHEDDDQQFNKLVDMNSYLIELYSKQSRWFISVLLYFYGR